MRASCGMCVVDFECEVAIGSGGCEIVFWGVRLAVEVEMSLFRMVSCGWEWGVSDGGCQMRVGRFR